MYSRKTQNKGKAKERRTKFFNSFRENVIESSEPISPKAFESIFSFGKEIFKYNKVPVIIYLVFCTLRSMEYLVRNIPFREFMIAIEKFEDSKIGSAWSFIATPLVYIVLALLAVDLLYRVSAVLLAYVVRPNIEYTVTRKITALLMRKPYNFFSKHPTSINNRIYQLAEGTYDATITLIEESIPATLGALGTVIATMFMDARIGIIMLAYFTIHVSTVLLYYGKYIRLSSCNSTSYNNLMRQTLNLIQNMPQVKAYGAEEFESKRINIFQNRRRKTNQMAFSYPERMKLLLTLNHTVAFITLMLTQISFFSRGHFNVADITFVTGNLYGIITLLYQATNASIKVVEDIGRCEEGIDFFRQSRFDNEIRVNKKYPPTLRNGGIIFNNVSFSYPADKKQLFQNQSIEIKPKEKIGIVGLSGSGKSTFVNLIMGYFLPSTGSVMVGGYDTSKTDMSWMRQHITMMSQTPQLFDRTILQNIQYGNNTPYKEIEKLCQSLSVHEFVEKLPYGYYTSVVDGGTNLSGGQRQRIALTRAIAKESQIVILDEATSAMDSHTQSVMQEGVKKLMKNKTAIIIAHKLETVVHMDKILVFKDGAIIESGSHKELMKKKNSHYSYLWQLSMSNAYMP